MIIHHRGAQAVFSREIGILQLLRIVSQRAPEIMAQSQRVTHFVHHHVLDISLASFCPAALSPRASSNSRANCCSWPAWCRYEQAS